MFNKTLSVLLFILSVSALVALLLSNRSEKVGQVESCSADTIVLLVTDTLILKDTVYIKRKVIDTIYIQTESGEKINLEVVQKHFRSDNIYDLWISGVEPLRMDSFYVYKQTEYRTIKEFAEYNKYRVYAGGGLFSFRETFTPYVGVSIVEPRKWLISANIGFNGYFGVEFKYNIFNYDSK